MIRMCIGLAYPPDTVPSWKEYDPPHTEEIPDEEDNMVPRRIVHFDFDPRNSKFCSMHSMRGRG